MKKLLMKLFYKRQVNMKWIFLMTLISMVSFGTQAQTGCPEQTDDLSVVKFDLDDCTSFFDEDSHSDYSEFTADNDNRSDCADMLLIGRSLYRESPVTNHHSCTPGFNGKEGMCVSASMNCDFEDDNEKAIRFDIEVTPGATKAQLKELKFYEKGPARYVWLDGESGDNNYPTKYGVRISVGGSEIYKRVDIPTNREWTIQTIDLSQIDGFEVDQPTIFSFELLGYCPEENGSDLSIWDIDDIAVYAGCTTEINGGMLTNSDGRTNIDLCVGDAVSFDLTPVLELATGTNQDWLVTDAQGEILDLPTGPTFDLQAFGPGLCKLYNVSYAGDLNGLSVGNNISELSGCYDLSNSIDIDKQTVEGAELDFQIGLDDCEAAEDMVIMLNTGPGDLPDGVDPQNNRWKVTQGSDTFEGTGNPFSVTLNDLSQVDIVLYNEVASGCEISAQKSFDPESLPAPEPRLIAMKKM